MMTWAVHNSLLLRHANAPGTAARAAGFKCPVDKIEEIKETMVSETTDSA